MATNMLECKKGATIFHITKSSLSLYHRNARLGCVLTNAPKWNGGPWSFVKQAVKLKKLLLIIKVNFPLSFSFSRWMSVIGRKPSPLSSSELRFARHDANLLGNYLSRPSIWSLFFLGALCVPLTWGHIKYPLSEVDNPIVISNPISNL